MKCLPLLLIILVLAPAAGAGGALVYSDPTTYDVRFGFTVESASPTPQRVQAWLPFPLDRPSQSIEGLSGEPTPTRRSKAPACFYWEWNDPADFPLHATMTFRLTTHATHLDRARYRYQPYNTRSAEYRRWTRPGPHVELSDAWIVGEAADLAVRYPDALDRARAAYDRVLDRMEYRLINGFGGAAFAARERYGECGDYSALFVALCRKAGIPARPIVGFWASELNEAHVWAEFYLEGVGWVPCDPSQGDLSDRDRHFGRLDNQRVVLSVGFDHELPFGFEGGRAEIMQTGTYWVKGGANVRFTPTLRATRVVVKP